MAKKIDVEVYITENTISDREAIRVAKSLPRSIPEGFMMEPLIPCGFATFKGDVLPPSWSVNGKFNIGKPYPIYSSEGLDFAIGNDGVGYKMTGKAWNKFHWF